MNIERIIENLKSLEKKQVTIGIHGQDGEQKKIVRVIPAYLPAKKGQREKINPNLTVAQVAAWNEFGTSRIPARSFLRDTLRMKRRELNIAALRILEEKPELFYEEMGNTLLNMIVLRIASGINPPNKTYTIRRKGRSTPLVDIGQLLDSLTYRVGSYG